MNKREKNNLKRAEQRKILLAQKKKKTQQKAIVSLIIIIAIVSIGFVIYSMGGNENFQDNRIVEETTVQSLDEIVIPLSEIGDEAKFYSYDSDGVKIQYFAVTGPDGDVRIALDACDVCYGAKKGYKQNGNVMQCINCGNEYRINGLGTENTYGGCWPSFLPIDIDNENVFIKISDLENKRYMFS